MFTRVGAFLEAIDKKSEALANAATREEEAARYKSLETPTIRSPLRQDARQSPPQHADHASRPSFPIPPFPTLLPMSVGSVLDGTEYARVGRLTRSGRSSVAMAPTTAPSTTPSFSSSSAVPVPQTSHSPTVQPPSKTPSLRPTSDEGRDIIELRGRRDVQSRRRGTQEGKSSSKKEVDALCPVPGYTHELDALDSTTSTAARWEAQCKALEADRARWQEEAVKQRALCSTARDALWKAEQEARTCNAAWRVAEEALAVYKETSHRLLKEAQQEIQRLSGTPGERQASAPNGEEGEREEMRLMRQQLELLQVDQSSLAADRARYQQEAASAAAELQRVREAHRESLAQAAELRLELTAARESLEGEAAAHTETRNALRALQGSAATRTLTDGSAVRSVSVGTLGTTSKESVGSDGELGPLREELKDLRWRHHMLTLTTSSQKAALDAATREVADVTARYDELARQMRDAEVEVAAGLRPSFLYASCVDGNGSWSGDFPPASTAGLVGSHRGGSGFTGDGRDALPHASSSGVGFISGNADPLRRRHPAMVHLVRRYGVIGRAAVAVLRSVDRAAISVGHALLHASWTWRVLLLSYIGLLQVWVLLMVIVGALAAEDLATQHATS